MPNPAEPVVADEVSDALRSGRGVVALESTLITHGLPTPDNLEVARGAEDLVRRAGAVPATIAVVGGVIRVGLSGGELERLALDGSSFLKAARRDLGVATGLGLSAATTVSATAWLARKCGIGVMATGGLGGVHRGASTTFDVSNDLDELARADGLVVACSGAKSILDLPATLDALETRGVSVVGYNTDTFPAFTSTSSGLPLEHRVDSPADAARVARAHRSLGLPGAIVLAQPVPPEVAVDPDLMERAIAEGLKLAEANQVAGKLVTPFLLDHVRKATGGTSLVANKALILNNARLAGEVAAALAGRPG